MRPLHRLAVKLLSAAAIVFPVAVPATGYLANPRSPDVAKELPRYDAVFVGQVIELKLVEAVDPFPEPGRMIPISETIVTFRVLRDFKDSKEPGVAVSEKSRLGYPFDEVQQKEFTVHARSAPTFDQALYPFELGRKYFVWASSRGEGAEARLEVYERDRPKRFPSAEAETELQALMGLFRSATEE